MLLKILLKINLFLILVNLSSPSNQIQRSILNKRTNHTNQFSLRDHFKNCDNLIKNKRFGLITSPFFPNPFPLPIYCRWIIDLSSFASKTDNQSLIIYLNEIYVKKGLKFTEYSFFLDENLNIDKNELQFINFNSNYSFIFTKKKYLVIQFQIDEQIHPNLQARVLNSPVNYNGFNLTFELTNRSLVKDQFDSKEICSFKKCNFNGRCKIDNLFKFNCECFSNYHGEFCEFGPSCDPFKVNNNVNNCLNGGSCIYSNDLVRIKCKCPENYSGQYCEKPQFNSQFNVTENSVYIIKLRSFNSNYEQRTNEDKFEIRFKQMVISLLRQYDQNLYVQEIKLNSNDIIEIHLFYQMDNEEFIEKIFKNEISKGSLGRFLLDKNYFEIVTRSAFAIIELNFENSTQLNEGDNITINCLIKGITQSINVKWFKDYEIINFNTKFRTLRHKISFLSNDLMKSTLSIINSTYLDSGSFTCSVFSDHYELKRSINLQLNKLQEPILSQNSKTAKFNENITIDCYTNARDYNLNSINQNRLTFGYTWLKNEVLVNQLNGFEIIQDLYPTGSRITILNITRPTKYKCVLTSLLGSSSKELFVDLIDERTLEDNVCKTQFNNGLRWEQSIINTETVQKCPDNYIGEIKRKCIYLDDDKEAAWSQIDYSNCLNIEFDKLFQKIRNHFLGYGNRKIEELIDDIITKIQLYKFKNGEIEPILKFIDENNEQLIQNRNHLNQSEYQRVLIKELNILNDLMETDSTLHNLMVKNQFQNLIFNISNQIDLETNSAIKNQKINFKNFNLFFIQNKNDLTTKTGHLPLMVSSNSSRFTFRSVHPGDKMILIIYKVNHFLLDIKQSFHHNKSIQNSNYIAFNLFKGSNKKFNKSSTNFEINLDEKFVDCVIVTFGNDKFVFSSIMNEKCNFNFNHFDQARIMFFRTLNYSKQFSNEQSTTFLKGNNKIAFNLITIISCSIIFISMLFNLKHWRSNSCLAGVLKLQLCISLIINHFSTAMALLSSNQKNENYWLMLFTLSQISALTIQFCIFITIEQNFDGSKSHFAKNISYRIAIVSTIVPFSLIGLIYEFYYTSYNNLLWTFSVGSTLFYSIICASLIITMANLFFYIKLNTKLQPFKKEDTLMLKFNKYENTSKILTNAIIITILLNVHLGFVLSIINMPSNVQNILISGYGLCSLIIVFIVLISSRFQTRMTKLQTSKRCSIENLSLNRQRKVFKHYNSSDQNSSNIFNNEIQSIFN